jgi:signal transduction histidine kinase
VLELPFSYWEGEAPQARQPPRVDYPNQHQLFASPGAEGCTNSGGSGEAFVRRLDNHSAECWAASRRQVIEAVDAEHARLARDVHNGAQHRLVDAVIALKLSRRALQDGDGAAEALVNEALDHAEQANAELSELAQGRLPWVLTHGGLRAGVESLAARVPLPVKVDVTVGRLAQTIEAHAYSIVADSLASVVEHSRGSAAEVRVAVDGGRLRVEVRDDGIGRARLEGSSGLRAIDDRVASLHGQMWVTRPPGGGTLIVACLPLS